MNGDPASRAASFDFLVEPILAEIPEWVRVESPTYGPDATGRMQAKAVQRIGPKRGFRFPIVAPALRSAVIWRARKPEPRRANRHFG